MEGESPFSDLCDCRRRFLLPCGYGRPRSCAARRRDCQDLRVVRERYAVGATTILDTLISQPAADWANTDAIKTRYDFILARAELEAILGERCE